MHACMYTYTHVAAEVGLVDSTYILPYPYFPRFLQNAPTQIIPLNVLRQELHELVGHATAHDIAVDGGAAALRVHHEQIRDIQLQKVHDEILGPVLLTVTLAHRPEELQQEVVMLSIFEPEIEENGVESKTRPGKG